MYEFDETCLDPQNTVVRCNTQQEADIFLEYLEHKGVWEKRQVSVLKQHWSQHRSSTCYHLSQPRWCREDWYREQVPEFRVVDFWDIYKCDCQENTEPEMSFDELMQGVI